MATTTTRTRSTSKKVDNRPVNLQPNHLPAAVTLIIGWLGAKTGTIQVPQNDKRSLKGNISWNGGIRKGWKIPGVPANVLATITGKVNGVDLKLGGLGIHTSEAGNVTMCLTGIVDLPNAETGKDEAHMAQLWVTHSNKRVDYSASLSVFPFTPFEGGPAVSIRGQVDGDFDLANEDDE